MLEGVRMSAFSASALAWRIMSINQGGVRARHRQQKNEQDTFAQEYDPFLPYTYAFPRRSGARVA
jgi:hypothetical protein